MTKFNAIMFAACLSADMHEEIDELLEAVEAETKKMMHEDKNLEELKNNFRHISSFIQGVDYMIDYIEDAETKKELREWSDTLLHETLHQAWAPLMQMCWTKELGTPVRISTTWLEDRKHTYDLYVGLEEYTGIRSMQGVREKLESIKQRKEQEKLGK